LAPRSLQRKFEQFNTFSPKKKFRTKMNVIKCPLLKNIKLLLQTHKNRPKILASFFFDILGTRGDKLSALIEFTPM